MSRRIVLGCSAAFAGAFDFGFLTVAAPAIDGELGLGAAYPWIFSAGSLAYGASVMPAGGLAGRVSPTRLLATGLLVAALGAAVVATAPAAPAALAGRVLFGLGGGMAAAPALALLAAIDPPPARRAAFARLGAAVTVGFTSGVVLAALVPSWRGVLLAFALALAALAAAARNPHPASERGQAPFAGSGGAWWFGGATVAASLALAFGAAAPALAVGGGVAAVVLARRGWRRASWLPPDRTALLALCAAGAATTASGVGAIVVIGREEGGIVLAAFGLAAPPATALARRLSQRHGATRAGGAGLALQAAGLAALVPTAAHAPTLVLPLLAFGAGHAIANGGTADAVTALAARHPAPAGGLLVTAQFAGGGAGALLTVAIAEASEPAVALALAAAIAAAGALALLALHPAHRALVSPS